MTDEWETLQKNVSKILKKPISMKDLKHIVAIINVMESAGVDFQTDVSDRSYISPNMPYEYDTDFQAQYRNFVQDMTKKPLTHRQTIDMIDKMSYTVHENLERQSKQITFEIDDRTIADMQPEQIREHIIASIYKAVSKQKRDLWSSYNRIGS